MTDIDDFINDLSGALEYWRYSHGDFDGWVESWGFDLQYAYERDTVGYNISGSYQHFVQQVMAEQIELYFCVWCGDSLYDCDIEDYNKCPQCGKFCAVADTEDKIERVHGMTPDNDALMDGARMAYDNFMDDFPQIWGLCQDIEDAQADLENAESREELLTALLMACHCAHVGGVISTDYGNVSFSDIDAISNGGLLALFDEDDIAWFLGE